jgi:hypothetical protein
MITRMTAKQIVNVVIKMIVKANCKGLSARSPYLDKDHHATLDRPVS